MRILMMLLACAIVLAPLPSRAQELLEVYQARLSEQDHFNSNGQRLTSAAAVIRQDRANYHRFGIRDAEDEDDSFFGDAGNRAALERLLERGRAAPGVVSQILNGTPLIRVEVWRGPVGVFVNVNLLEGPQRSDGSGNSRSTQDGFVMPITPPSSAAAITADDALALSRQIGGLESQIRVLTQVIDEQNDLKKKSSAAIAPTIDATIEIVNARVEELQKQSSERTRNLDAYLTSVKPDDRDTYMTARKASQSYPKIPFYIPGTNETGEFWVEPVISDQGEMSFKFKFVDVDSTVDKVREAIGMTLSEIEETQRALFKLHEWSKIAHEQKLRKNYEKRVTCFPVSQCPPEGERVEGKASTEIRFNVYEDGSTAGRIQRNKGRFVEGYNVSTDSAMLLQAYLSHVIKVAKQEFRSGTQEKQDLDKMFQ